MTDVLETLRDLSPGYGRVIEAAVSEIENLRAEVNAPISELVGRVMKNSGGSANPETVEKVIRALRGERVSFVPLPKN